ncbi:MAG: GreA/GreB family elongation factor [Bacteroidales bacterium]|nr:GreA/GreB family elongation factor [Bacteroidales bacterium]
MTGEIYITELDYTRLCNLINNVKAQKSVELKNLDALGAEIKRAKRIEPKKIAPEFVTMNSEIVMVDMDNKKEMKIKLVYPQDADFKKGFISVLSPLGSALLGYKMGDVISFEVPAGKKKVRIKSIIYQPESHGEFTV